MPCMWAKWDVGWLWFVVLTEQRLAKSKSLQLSDMFPFDVFFSFFCCFKRHLISVTKKVNNNSRLWSAAACSEGEADGLTGLHAAPHARGPSLPRSIEGAGLFLLMPILFLEAKRIPHERLPDRPYLPGRLIKPLSYWPTVTVVTARHGARLTMICTQASIFKS